MFLFRSHDTQKTTINPSFSFHCFGIVNFESKTNNRRLQSLQGRRKKPARGRGRTRKNAKGKGRGGEGGSLFLSPNPPPFPPPNSFAPTTLALICKIRCKETKAF